MKIIILMLFGFLFNGVSFANPIPEKVPRIYIFHINGVNTKLSDAFKNLEALKATANIKSNIIRWDLLYNETHGLLTSDLWDVMKMKKQEAQNLTTHDYMVIYMKRFNLDYPINSGKYNELKEEIKEKFMKDVDAEGKNLSDLARQLSVKVGNTFGNNAYILLLPHSQGNQYANLLWEDLINRGDYPKNNVAIFGIASPTDHLNGTVKPIPATNQVSYYTADNDYVINSLSMLTHLMPLTHPPMPGNMHLNTCGDLLCHELIGSYLTDKQSKKLISDKINAFVISIKKNLIEKEFGENINALFWLDEKLASSAILRSENGAVMCANGKCDGDINYLDTDLSKFDPYKDYKWSTDWPIGEDYLLLVPHNKLAAFINPNPNDYFFIRGGMPYVIDSSNIGCTYKKRDTRKIENSTTSPFYGKSYGSITTIINNGCKIPDYMLADNKTKVVLGTFLINSY